MKKKPERSKKNTMITVTVNTRRRFKMQALMTEMDMIAYLEELSINTKIHDKQDNNEPQKPVA